MLCIFRRGVSASRCVKRFKERSMLRYNRRWFGAFKLGCLGCTFGKVFLLDLLWMLLCKLCCRAVETAFGNDLSRSTPSLLSEKVNTSYCNAVISSIYYTCLCTTQHVVIISWSKEQPTTTPSNCFFTPATQSTCLSLSPTVTHPIVTYPGCHDDQHFP